LKEHKRNGGPPTGSTPPQPGGIQIGDTVKTMRRLQSYLMVAAGRLRPTARPQDHIRNAATIRNRLAIPDLPRPICLGLDKPQPSCKTAKTIKTGGIAMQIDRRRLAFPVLAIGLLSAVPAFAGADEDAIAKNLEAFRAAQMAGNTEVIASICADELSYSHSNAKIDTKASLLNGIATANYKWTSLDYKDPSIRVVGPAAIVRFSFVGEQEFTDGKKTPQNLHILMNWQKQGNDWKLLSRAATKL
jgi:uncharacterized protein DUF4440